MCLFKMQCITTTTTINNKNPLLKTSELKKHLKLHLILKNLVLVTTTMALQVKYKADDISSGPPNMGSIPQELSLISTCLIGLILFIAPECFMRVEEAWKIKNGGRYHSNGAPHCLWNPGLP